MKADTLLVAAGEALLAMLLLAELAVVVAFEPVVAWLWHCHQFE
jgi:FtsP/CotA-like multicopper oxidase with cupredoxin domain